ncbi:MAG: T9SS type A sorting domain-containing protein [Bacteroidetes bacterium]|nr:T9SS type A sorting domain-containing protein [Bacteroidota bacterium]
MKKQLLYSFTFIALMLANFSFAQQNRTSVSPAPAKALSKNGVTPKKGTQAVITTTTSTCMSINLPAPATWSLVNYGTGTPIFADGFVNGPNIYGDREKAMYFDVSATANTMITQVYVGFDHAYSATPTKTVAVKFYDGTSLSPGAALGSGTLSMGTIMTDVSNNQYSLIIFPTPILLPASKRFFASVDISALQWTSTVKDSLSIISNSDNQTIPSAAWEKWSTNAWHNMGSTTTWTLDISLLIHPFLTQAPITATFSTPSNTVCTGQSVTYNSAGSTSPGTYEWYYAAITATPNATGVTATTSYSVPGTYTTTMIMEDACGSLGAVQKTISVIPSPTVSATPSSTTVCSGKSVTLNGNGASTYAWTGGVTNNVAFVPASSGNYTVTGTAANGCTNSAVASVVVNTTPTVTANTSTTSVCSGNNVTLTGGGASTYAWTGGVTNNVAFAPSSTSSYTVTGTAANSCTNTAVVSVTVNPTPSVSATPSATSICQGDTVILNGNGASTYAWTGGVTNNTAFTPSATTAYTVTGTNTIGCSATAVSNVIVNSNPSVTANTTSTLICTGNTVTLNGGGANVYVWSSGVNNNVPFSPTTTATYTVTGFDANNCKNTATVSVVVSACTDIANIEQTKAQFIVYPNPNNGNFVIELNGFNGTSSIEIYNSIGKLVYSQDLTTEKNNLTTNLSSGIYFVNVIENGKVIAVQKLICE